MFGVPGSYKQLYFLQWPEVSTLLMYILLLLSDQGQRNPPLVPTFIQRVQVWFPYLSCSFSLDSSLVFGSTAQPQLHPHTQYSKSCLASVPPHCFDSNIPCSYDTQGFTFELNYVLKIFFISYVAFLQVRSRRRDSSISPGNNSYCDTKEHKLSACHLAHNEHNFSHYTKQISSSSSILEQDLGFTFMYPRGFPKQKSPQREIQASASSTQAVSQDFKRSYGQCM